MKEKIDAFVGAAPQFDHITMLSLELMPQNGPGMKKLKLTPSLESMEQVTAFVEQELETAGIPTKVIAQIPRVSNLNLQFSFRIWLLTEAYRRCVTYIGKAYLCVYKMVRTR